MKETQSGQIAIEFIFMLGMAMILMIAFLAILYPLIAEKQEEDRDQRFTDLGEFIQRELLLAQAMHPGYTRTVVIPPSDLNSTFEHEDYTILVNETSLVITTSFQHYNFPIPNTTGNITIGSNVIITQENNILLNP
jgi:hypothetical protein